MNNDSRQLFARILRAVANELDPPVNIQHGQHAEERSGGTGRPPPPSPRP